MHIKIIFEDKPSGEIFLDVPEDRMWHFDMAIAGVRLGIKKGADYTGSRSWYDNFIGGGLKGIYNRIMDKMGRLKTLLLTGGDGEVSDERFLDTCIDLANYAYILCQAREEGVSVEGEDWK